MNVPEMVPTLQISIGPMILISGIGLILLAMTNRYGRVTDRARSLRESGEIAKRLPKGLLAKELVLLNARARNGRIAILFTSFSLLFAALLVCVLFAISYWRLDWGWLIMALFGACMLSFVTGLILFIRDVNLSLKTFRVSEKAYADL